ncbi:3,4-dihydroxy-2-butanone-4-phosphate synthase [Amycolatopsis sp. cmx-8-4]|uniref:3,4-dihydroxy-2-butanone-4-phosphate synthase n=1 Tax=Amycolatopsis sp. cmx-8-4 TaxID=2790947 RepID=UPI00397D841F
MLPRLLKRAAALRPHRTALSGDGPEVSYADLNARANRLDRTLCLTHVRDGVTVDAADGVTTGISATDRATTLSRLADPLAAPAAGHVMTRATTRTGSSPRRLPRSGVRPGGPGPLWPGGGVHPHRQPPRPDAARQAGRAGPAARRVRAAGGELGDAARFPTRPASAA